MGNRAVSEDGSRIVFSSAEPLSPAATNGQVNAMNGMKARVKAACRSFRVAVAQIRFWRS